MLNDVTASGIGGILVWRTRRWWGMVSGLVVLVVITLCATYAAPVAGAPSPRACGLVALTDVAGILGGGFMERQDVALTGGHTMSNCAYHRSAGNVALSLHQITYDSAQYLQREQTAIAQQRGVTVTPVGGLGPGAFYYLGPNPRGASGLFQLHFGKGRRLVSLWVATSGRPDIQAAQSLARVAYARLP